jgi:hypothetical protein
MTYDLLKLACIDVLRLKLNKIVEAAVSMASGAEMV